MTTGLAFVSKIISMSYSKMQIRLSKILVSFTLAPVLDQRSDYVMPDKNEY